MRIARSVSSTLFILSTLLIAHAQQEHVPTPAPQNFALTETNDLVVSTGNAETVEYQGRKAVRLTAQSDGDVFAFLKGLSFQDGTIEVDLAANITTPPGVRMPGFIGIAFRTRPDAKHYELFYLRPRNSESADQAMRNHSVQYVAQPGFDWYRLRREWPWIYESYADLHPQTWTKVKIEVHGRSATLYVNGSVNPSLVVNGLKGEDLQGGVALWGNSGEEAYFSNLKVIHAAPQSVAVGSEVAGKWSVHFGSDYGAYTGTMNLHREGEAITGKWSGAFGPDQPVHGTWRNGYIELTFNGTWSEKDPAPITATLAGWIDADSASGRMKVEGRADGQWTAEQTK